LALSERLVIDMPDGKGGVIPEEVPLRNAMNEVTRHAYIEDCAIGTRRWNRLIAEAGHDFRLALPSPRFHRSVGVWAVVHTDPQGKPIGEEEWASCQSDWLPGDDDRAFVQSLMVRVTEPGKMAGWLAPPEIGIDNLPADYEYVRLH
jgi:benzoyl-CoA 2,3-epoxidase subunit B